MTAPTKFSSVPTGQNTFTINDMNDNDVAILEKNMRPLMLSAEGFLDSTESLRATCERDWNYLNSQEISCELLGCALRTIIETADSLYQNSIDLKQKINSEISFNKTITVWEKFLVDGLAVGTIGYQSCPFDGPKCCQGRHNYTITNSVTKKSLSVSPLGIDLIEKHGFFQGNVSHRIDPKTAIDVLELKPGNEQIISNKTLKFDSINDYDSALLNAIKNDAKKVITIDENTKAYFGIPYNDIESELSLELSSDDKDTSLYPQKKRKIEIQKPPKEYCHIVINKDRTTNHPFITSIDNVVLNKPITDPIKSVFVYEMKDTKKYKPH